MEECAHGLDSKCLVEKPPVEKGTVYGIDALLKNKEIQGVGQMRYKDVNTRAIERKRGNGICSLPGRSYRRVDSLNHHSNHGSFGHAWE